MNKSILYGVLCILFGLAVGSTAALISSGAVPLSPDETAVTIDGHWITDFEIGSTEASGALRARIARKGLFALRRSEAVYYIRSVDDKGEALLANCTYRLTGDSLPTGWWSVTLYDEKSMLALNADDAASVNQDEVVKEDGRWVAWISDQRPAEAKNWISSKGTQTFDLTLRLYQPDLPYLMSGNASGFPSLERTGCAGGGAP